jgi:hypothetical protein
VTCCGKGREALRSGSSPVGNPGTELIGDGPLLLEPREQTTFYARGAATGKRYVFDPAGPAQLVDPADAPALLASGVLRIRP